MIRSLPRLALLTAALAFPVACTLGSAPDSSEPAPSDDPTDPADPADPVGDCAEPLATTEGPLGALAATDDGYLYVAGAGRWQLAEIELATSALTPVVELDSSWIEESWVEVRDDDVYVYEFYPRGVLLAFDRQAREVREEDGASPTYGARPPHLHDGDRYSVLIGREDNPCGNVCIVREGEAGPTPIVDDADEPFSVHSGGVHFVEGWAYFMTYPSSTSSENARAFRRVNLSTGDVELVHTFPEGAANAWIQDLVATGDGNLYWVRGQQQELDDDWVGTIDRHKIVANATELGVATGLDRHAGQLRQHGERLVFVDGAGVHSFDPEERVDEVVVDMFIGGPAYSSIYVTTHGDRLYYSQTSHSREAPYAEVGCVDLE